MRPVWVSSDAGNPIDLINEFITHHTDQKRYDFASIIYSMNSIDQLKVRPQGDDSSVTFESTLFYVLLLNEVRQAHGVQRRLWLAMLIQTSAKNYPRLVEGIGFLQLN